MKKIIYLLLAIIITLNPVNAAEKKNCSGMKKFSKEFIACKAGNFKKGLNITKKKENKKKSKETKKPKNNKKIANVQKIKETTKKTTENLRDTIANKKAKIKNTFNNIWGKTTKRYPKGTKK